MKQSKAAGIVLTVMNAILIVICAALYFRTDKTAPEIEFTAADIVYRENMDNAKLYEGITAYDSEDGDVTDRIVIEKTIEVREENRIVIFYAVSDKAGNVTKASRIFNAVYTDESSLENAEDADQFLEAGINAELKQDYVIKDSQEGGDTLSDEQEDSAFMEEPAEEASEKSTAEAETTPTPEAAKESTPEPTPTPTADPSVPVLTLKVSEVTVNAGQGPAWVDVIAALSDDKDSYETLFKNLSVSKYDKDKAGSYQVTVSTEDSDGNKSQPVPLTIIVK